MSETPERTVKPLLGTVTTEEYITPERAQRILDNTQFPYQRTLGQQHVRNLATAMRRGEFYDTPIEVCTIAGQEKIADYLTDGQHRLHAIILSGIPQTLTLIYRHLPDFDAICRRYAAIDSGRIRKPVERMRPVVRDSTNDPKTVEIVSRAVTVIQDGFTYKRSMDNPILNSPYARADIYAEWKEYHDVIHEATYGSGTLIRRSFRRTHVLAVFLVTAKYQCARTKELLEEIAANDGLKKHSPAWHYVNTCVPKAAQGGHLWEYECRILAALWNCHYRGDGVLTKLYARDPEKPIVILGTPYNGKEQK